MDETHGDQPDQYIKASQSKRRWTGSMDVPALRLGRRVASNRAQQPQQNTITGVATATIAPDASPPRLLRLIRVLVGIAVLGVAWAGILALVMLVEALFQPLTRQHIVPHLLLDVVLIGATCLTGITVLGCLILGAFCIALAVTSRDWQ